jgi:hypothetical protein
MKHIIWAVLLLLACKRAVEPARAPVTAYPAAAARAALASVNVSEVPVWTDKQIKEMTWTGVASQDEKICLSHRTTAPEKKPADEFERRDREIQQQTAGAACKQDMDAKLKAVLHGSAIVEVALRAGEYDFTVGAFPLEFVYISDEADAGTTYLNLSDVRPPGVLLSPTMGGFLALSAKHLGSGTEKPTIEKRRYTLRLPEAEARALKSRFVSEGSHLRIQFLFRPLSYGDSGFRIELTGDKINAVNGEALGMRVIDDAGEIAGWEPLL